MKRLWITALGALLADLISKGLAAAWLGQQTVRLGWLVELRVTHNTGIAFGMLSDSALAVLALPLTVILCGWLLMRRYRMTAFTATACGLVLGGFVGNFGQRILHGSVLDMLYFPWLPWFVCNVADICICLGVALLALSLLMRPQDWEEKAHAEN